MRAAGVNHEDAPGHAVHPDAVIALKLCLHTQREVLRIADGEDRLGLEQRARKKEAQEHQEVDTEIAPDARPNDPSAHLVGSCGCFFRGLFCRSLGRRSGGDGCGRALGGFCFGLVSHMRPGHLKKIKKTNLAARPTDIYMTWAKYCQGDSMLPETPVGARFQRSGSAAGDFLPVARNTMSASAAINFGESPTAGIMRNFSMPSFSASWRASILIS